MDPRRSAEGAGVTMQLREETALLLLIHDALRRDAERLAAAVLRGDLADPSRLPALRAGWQTFHTQLLRHHREQDLFLLPTARIYLPARHEEIAVLDVVEHGHRHLEALAAPIDTALVSGDVTWFAEAVTAFGGALAWYLQHAETAAVPLLETTLGERDWRSYGRDQRRALTGRTAAVFWPWVLEGADPARAAQVVRHLPAPTRTLLARVWMPRFADTARW